MAFWSFLVAATLALLAGCGAAASSAGGNNADAAAAPPESLKDARQLWLQQGFERYSVTAQMTCYCPVDLVQPIRLEVEGGTVVSSQGVDQPLENLTGKGAQRLTVEGLFQFIEEAEDRKAHKLDVSYDRQYGFPTRIDYDGHPMIADDERKYRLTDFNPGVAR